MKTKMSNAKKVKHLTMSASLAMLAISGCSLQPTRALAKTSAQAGRVIEFKSGAEGFDTRTFFYEGENEVVAFDAQFTPALAEASIQHLRKFTAKPITWLVITHPNPDKFNGASVFRAAGAKILASHATAEAIPGVHAYKEYFFVEMAKMFSKGTYPQPVPVDQTFRGKMDLVLSGGERIELRELTQPGVSSTQTVAYVGQAEVLFVGDLVHHQAHAWLEGGIVNSKPEPALHGWIEDLRELASLYPTNTVVHGGRGISAVLERVVPAQIAYLRKAERLVQAELQGLGEKASGFDGPQAGEMYKALAGKFAKAFPAHDLAYLIEYGVYGLVQFERSR